ncbi:MAG: hypothetical protein K2L38_05950 [Dysosmobacter sp.]|nr:hypothetical protein [Dysosmobacter sp.]
MREEISVRQWQERFKAGTFDSPYLHTQCEAGWYDWFCRDNALAGRLKKIGRVVMGVTSPFLLDNFYVWFKNNALTSGQMYDDVRFEPLSGERDGKYFLITLDHPGEKGKWALYTERYGFGIPEFVCANIREMTKYVNELGTELENDVPGPLVLEEQAVAEYIASQPDLQQFTSPHRLSEHTYSIFMPKENRKEFIHAALNPDAAPVGFQKDQAVQINGIYVSRHNHEVVVSQDVGHHGRKPSKEKEGCQR